MASLFWCHSRHLESVRSNLKSWLRENLFKEQSIQFHPDPIWNDRALSISFLISTTLITRRTRTGRKTGWVATWGQFLIQKIILAQNFPDKNCTRTVQNTCMTFPCHFVNPLTHPTPTSPVYEGSHLTMHRTIRLMDWQSTNPNPHHNPNPRPLARCLVKCDHFAKFSSTAKLLIEAGSQIVAGYSIEAGCHLVTLKTS